MKKSIALILALLLLAALFAGCTKTAEPAANGSTNTGSSNSGTATAEPASEDTGITFPLSDSVTLTQWRPFSSTMIDTPADIPANIEIEKRTNVKIDYWLAASASAQEAYNLLITSQDYPDIFFQQNNYYTGGYDKGINDGVFLRLNEYIDRWAPNYKAKLLSDNDIRKQSTTDSGNIATFNCINGPGQQPPWVGPMIRVDFLNDAGIGKTPETYDELHTALSAFRDAGVEQPYAMGYLGYSELAYGLMSGFDVGPGFYNENGTVKYGFIEQGFRDYVTMAHTWYAEGLIDKDFYTKSASRGFVDQADVQNNKVGAADAIVYTMPPVYAAGSEDPDFTMRAMPFPRKNAGDIAHFRRVNDITGTTPALLRATLADDLTRLEIVVKWMDYRYSEEGSNMLNYGLEGDSMEFVNGNPQFTEVVYKNPEYSFSNMMEKYTDCRYGAYYLWVRENVAFSPEELAAYDIWSGSASGDWVMPPVDLTAEEGTEYSAIYGDIQTYVQENVAKLITGSMSLDKLDEFVNQIKSMNIDRCIAIQQAALDRYNAR